MLRGHNQASTRNADAMIGKIEFFHPAQFLISFFQRTQFEVQSFLLVNLLNRRELVPVSKQPLQLKTREYLETVTSLAT